MLTNASPFRAKANFRGRDAGRRLVAAGAEEMAVPEEGPRRRGAEAGVRKIFGSRGLGFATTSLGAGLAFALSTDGASPSTTCALVPPKPNELTAAILPALLASRPKVTFICCLSSCTSPSHPPRPRSSYNRNGKDTRRPEINIKRENEEGEHTLILNPRMLASD